MRLEPQYEMRDEKMRTAVDHTVQSAVLHDVMKLHKRRFGLQNYTLNTLATAINMLIFFFFPVSFSHSLVTVCPVRCSVEAPQAEG